MKSLGMGSKIVYLWKDLSHYVHVETTKEACPNRRGEPYIALYAVRALIDKWDIDLQKIVEDEEQEQK